MREIFSVKKFATLSLSASFLRIFGSFISLVINVLIARFYQPEVVGQYFITLGCVVFLAQLSTLGSSKSLLKALPCYQQEVEKNICFTSALILSSLVSVTLFFLYEWTLQWIITTELSLPLILFTALYFVILSSYQAIGQPIISVSLQFIVQPIIFAAITTTRFFSLVDSYFFSILISLLFLVCHLFRKKVIRIAKVNLLQVYTFGEMSIPYFFMLLMGLLVSQFAVPFSSIWLNDSEIAVVGILMRLVSVIYFTVSMMRTLTLPVFSEFYSKGHGKALKKVSFVGVLIPTIVIVLASVVTGVFGELILSVFGEFYIHYSSLLFILVLMLLPASVFGWVESLLIAQEERSVVITLSAISAITLFAMLFVFSSSLGVYAVLIMVGIKSFYAMTTAIYYFQRRA